MSNPIDPNGIVDLGKVKENADARDEEAKRLAAQKRQVELLQRAASFDNAMQRAFKGIVSRPERHRAMMRSGA